VSQWVDAETQWMREKNQRIKELENERNALRTAIIKARAEIILLNEVFREEMGMSSNRIISRIDAALAVAPTLTEQG
jgi:hypothetical protein